MKGDPLARNFSEALVLCAGPGVPLVERSGSTRVWAWARSRARRKSHEACPSEEIDRLYFFEAHRDGLIVAHILPRGAVHQTPIGFVCRLSPRGMPTRVRMAAFVRKVAIRIKGLRRWRLFGGVCVNQGLASRGRNATAKRDAPREIRVSHRRRLRRSSLVLGQRLPLLVGAGFARGSEDLVQLVAGEVVERVHDGLGPLVGLDFHFN